MHAFKNKKKSADTSPLGWRRSSADHGPFIDTKPRRQSSPALAYEPKMSVFRRRSSGNDAGLDSVATHDSNSYLAVCDYLLQYPRVHGRMLQKLEMFHVVDIALMFHVKGMLTQALLSVMKVEVDDNKRKGLQEETFRQETPAMLLVGACLSLDTTLAYRQNFVSDVTVALMGRLKWTPKVMVRVVRDGLKTLASTARHMPEELIMVLKALYTATGSTDTRIMSSVFFLRFICPGLAQPQTQGGLDKVPAELRTALLQTAKAFQLVANRMPPGEGSFAHPVAKDLAALYPLMDKIFETVAAGGPGRTSPPVTKSLAAPAKATIKALSFLSFDASDEAAHDAFEALLEAVGPLSITSSHSDLSSDGTQSATASGTKSSKSSTDLGVSKDRIDQLASQTAVGSE